MTVIYIVIYRDVVFCPKLLFGIDWPVPATSLSVILRPIIATWNPLGLGVPYGANFMGYGFNIYSFLAYAFFWIVSFGNRILWQKLFFAGTLIAGFGMYFFLRRHVTRSKAISIVVAIIYAYGPVTAWNYGSGIIWQYALFPFVVSYLLSILSQNGKIRDSLLLALSLTLLTAFGLHLFLVVPILFIIFLLINLYTSDKKLSYLSKSIGLGVLASILLLAVNPSLLVMALGVYGLSWMSSTVAFTAPYVSIDWFFIIYPMFTTLNAFTLTTWLYNSIMPEASYILMVIVLSSIPLCIKGYARRGVTIGLWAMYFLGIGFANLPTEAPSIFKWVYENFRFISIERGGEVFTLLFAFLRSALIGVALSPILNRIFGTWHNDMKIVAMGRLKVKPIMTAGVILILVLSSFFLYEPVFLEDLHPKYDCPTVYDEIRPWLGTANGPGDFRYLLAPIPFSSLGYLEREYPNQFQGWGTSQSDIYMLYSKQMFASNREGWDYLLSLGNVRYIIVIDGKREAKISILSGFTEGAPAVAGVDWGYGLTGNSAQYINYFTHAYDGYEGESQIGYLGNWYNIGGSVSYRRVGEQLTIVWGKYITGIALRLQRIGNPSGNMYYRIRTSNDSILAEVEFPCSDVPQNNANFVVKALASPVYVGKTVRILAEYEGGDASNYIQVANVVGDFYLDGYTTLHDGKSYNGDKTFDVPFRLYLNYNAPKTKDGATGTLYKEVASGDGFTVFENRNVPPKVQAFDDLIYVIGDLDSARALTTLPGYTYNRSLLYFADGAPEVDLKILNRSSTVLFYNRDYSDLIMSLLKQRYGVPLYKFGHTHYYLIHKQWVRVSPQLSEPSKFPTSGFLTYGNDIIESWPYNGTYPSPWADAKPSIPLNIPVNIESPGRYEIWLRILYYKDSSGKLTGDIDGKPLTIPPSATETTCFKWVRIGAYDLAAGLHTVNLTNSGWYRALDTLIVVPDTALRETASLAKVMLADKTIIHMGNPEFLLTPKTVSPDGATYELRLFAPTDGMYRMMFHSKSEITSPAWISSGTEKSIFRNLNGTEWIASEKLLLKEGVQNLTISLPKDFRSYLLFLSGPNGAGSPFKSKDRWSIETSFERKTDTEYVVHIENTNRSHLYLVLFEAFGPNWHAYVQGKRLPHFQAFEYANGFLYENPGNTPVTIRYEGPNPQVINLPALVIALVAATLSCPPLYRRVSLRLKKPKT